MDRAEFLKKLSELVEKAKGQGGQIAIDEVKGFFEKEELTEEQMELVFDYLLSQKVVVKGYLKINEEEEKLSLTAMLFLQLHFLQVQETLAIRHLLLVTSFVNLL